VIAASAIVGKSAVVVSQRFLGISYAELCLFSARFFLQSLRSRNRSSPFGIQRYSRKLGQIFENKNLLSDLNKISYTQERRLASIRRVWNWIT